MSQEQDTLKKDTSVDKLKGFAILAVIFGHISSPLTGFIFSWHMPLFFFISGFFIKTDDTIKVFLAKNFKRIMVYFFVFALIGLCATDIKNIVLHRENESILTSLVGIFYWMDSAHLNSYGFVLWFLPALYWGKFFIFILIKYVRNHFIITTTILVFFFLTIYSKIRLPFALDLGILSSLWIYMGYVFYTYLKDYILKYWSYISLLTIASIFIFSIPGLDMSMRYFSNPLYNIIFSIGMIILLYGLINKIPTKSKLAEQSIFLGKNSLFLFIFHPYTNNIVYLFAERFFYNLWYIKFILSFASIYLILVIIRKYFNKGILNYV